MSKITKPDITDNPSALARQAEQPLKGAELSPEQIAANTHNDVKNLVENPGVSPAILNGNPEGKDAKPRIEIDGHLYIERKLSGGKEPMSLKDHLKEISKPGSKVKVLILSAEAGMGKSTELECVKQTAGEDYEILKIDASYIMRLASEMKQNPAGSQGNLRDAVLKAAEREGKGNSKIILIDTFDPYAYAEGERFFADLLPQLTSDKKDGADYRMVIASRPEEARRLKSAMPDESAVRTVELAPFGKEDILKLWREEVKTAIKKCENGKAEVLRQKTEEVTRLLSSKKPEELKDAKSLWTLLENPLHIRLLAESLPAIENLGQIDENSLMDAYYKAKVTEPLSARLDKEPLCQVYEMEMENAEGGKEKGREKFLGEREQFLQKTALRLLELGRLDFEENELPLQETEDGQQKALAEATRKLMLENLVSEGVLTLKEGRYRFCHQTVWEYVGARKICELKTHGISIIHDLISIADHTPIYREILLKIGLQTPSKTALISQILTSDKLITQLIAVKIFSKTANPTKAAQNLIFSLLDHNEIESETYRILSNAKNQEITREIFSKRLKKYYKCIGLRSMFNNKLALNSRYSKYDVPDTLMDEYLNQQRDVPNCYKLPAVEIIRAIGEQEPSSDNINFLKLQFSQFRHQVVKSEILKILIKFYYKIKDSSLLCFLKGAVHNFQGHDELYSSVYPLIEELLQLDSYFEDFFIMVLAGRKKYGYDEKTQGFILAKLININHPETENILKKKPSLILSLILALVHVDKKLALNPRIRNILLEKLWQLQSSVVRKIDIETLKSALIILLGDQLQLMAIGPSRPILTAHPALESFISNINQSAPEPSTEIYNREEIELKLNELRHLQATISNTILDSKDLYNVVKADKIYYLNGDWKNEHYLEDRLCGLASEESRVLMKLGDLICQFTGKTAQQKTDFLINLIENMLDIINQADIFLVGPSRCTLLSINRNKAILSGIIQRLLLMLAEIADGCQDFIGEFLVSRDAHSSEWLMDDEIIKQLCQIIKPSLSRFLLQSKTVHMSYKMTLCSKGVLTRIKDINEKIDHAQILLKSPSIETVIRIQILHELLSLNNVKIIPLLKELSIFYEGIYKATPDYLKQGRALRQNFLNEINLAIQKLSALEDPAKLQIQPISLGSEFTLPTFSLPKFPPAQANLLFHASHGLPDDNNTFQQEFRRVAEEIEAKGGSLSDALGDWKVFLRYSLEKMFGVSPLSNLIEEMLGKEIKENHFSSEEDSWHFIKGIAWLAQDHARRTGAKPFLADACTGSGRIPMALYLGGLVSGCYGTDKFPADAEKIREAFLEQLGRDRPDLLEHAKENVRVYFDDVLAEATAEDLLAALKNQKNLILSANPPWVPTPEATLGEFMLKDEEVLAYLRNPGESSLNKNKLDSLTKLMTDQKVELKTLQRHFMVNGGGDGLRFIEPIIKLAGKANAEGLSLNLGSVCDIPKFLDLIRNDFDIIHVSALETPAYGWEKIPSAWGHIEKMHTAGKNYYRKNTMQDDSYLILNVCLRKKGSSEQNDVVSPEEFKGFLQAYEQGHEWKYLGSNENPRFSIKRLDPKNKKRIESKEENDVSKNS